MRSTPIQGLRWRVKSRFKGLVTVSVARGLTGTQPVLALGLTSGMRPSQTDGLLLTPHPVDGDFTRSRPATHPHPIMKKFFFAAFAALFVFGLSACERSTEIETTPGEPTEVEIDIEPGISEEMEESMDNAGDAIREGANDAGDAIREGANDAGDAMQEGADDVRDAANAAAEEVDGDGN